MDMKSAIEKFSVTDEFCGKIVRYMGLFDFNLGARIYPFQVDIYEISDGGYEVILTQEDSMFGDRDMFFVNTLSSNALCYQLEKFLSNALGLQISLTWGAHIRQTDDRLVLVLKEGV